MITEVKKTKPKTSDKKMSNSISSESSQGTNALEFAVIATGGKQYLVSPGKTIKIEKIVGEQKEGDKLTFENVLIVDNGSETTIGDPYITGAKVIGTLLKIARDKKVEVIKYKQKSRYFVRRGHRQHYFLVKVDSIR